MAQAEISRRAFVGRAAGAALGAGLTPAAAADAGPTKVMIIRHAEKPELPGEPPFGVAPDGRQDPHALLVRGWQRVGALARLFFPRAGDPLAPGLARPDSLFNAAATADHPSERSGLTLSAVAALGGLGVDGSFGPDQELGAAAAILRRDGVSLAAWEHRRIAALVSAVTGGRVAGPHWPHGRYDMVLVLDRDGADWRLSQVPQLLLAGDSAEPLPAAKG